MHFLKEAAGARAGCLIHTKKANNRHFGDVPEKEVTAFPILLLKKVQKNSYTCFFSSLTNAG